MIMNEFEKAISEIETASDSYLEGENCIEFLRGNKTATVTFTQPRYITKIRKLAKKYPDRVGICHDTGSLIVAHIPVRAIRISILEGREMTQEQKDAARERLAKYREKKEAEAETGSESLDLDLEDFWDAEEEEN